MLMWPGWKKWIPALLWLGSAGLVYLIWANFLDGEPSGNRQLDWELPDGFVMEEATLPGLVKYPMFAIFDDQGRLFVMESSGKTESTAGIVENPDFRILLLEDNDEDGLFEQRTVFADSLSFPMGGVFVDGSLIVTNSPNLMKFTDTDGDGVADERKVLLSGWKLNHNAAILSGPFMGPDGWLYLADARRGFDIFSKESTRFEGAGARIWRCLPDGSQLQSFAGGGFDNAVELTFTPSGEVLGTMTYFTDPQGGYRDALMHWVENGVYPKPHPVISQDQLRRTGDLMPVMHRMARVSPSGLMRHTGSGGSKEFEGNLFHAEFNTGRIIRSILTPAGASFQVEAQPFFQSRLPDFHPTDVLQEPNGNLLLVNTGGWFIAGCPLSRTAKPDVPGGIFRIRKREASEQLADPWGKEISWDDLSVGELARLLEDPRRKVSEKAGNYLLQKPKFAVPFLQRLMQEHPEERVRANAVFLLFRSQQATAWNSLHTGLDDTSDLVKTATARVLGMGDLKAASEKLIHVLEETASLSLLKQVAVALGQIADPLATQPLLQALKRYPEDRFFEHAVIFALIEMENEALLLEELAVSGFNKAIVIALDQKGKSLLTEEAIASYLTASDPTVQETGVWVLKNHPEWHRAFVSFLETQANRPDTDPGRVVELWPVFVDQAPVQAYISREMRKNLGTARGEWLLSLLASLPPKNPSVPLYNSLRLYLREGDRSVQEATLGVISQINSTSFSRELNLLSRSDEKAVSLRLKAYQALVAQSQKIEDVEFQWIAQQLLQADARQHHALVGRVLRDIAPDENRLNWLLEHVFPFVSSENLPMLLELFNDAEQPEIRLALEQVLLQRKDAWDLLSIDMVSKIFAGKKWAIVDSLEQTQRSRLTSLEVLESNLLAGDVARGRAVFYGKGTCGTCHAVAGEGGTFGPDLTNIGEIRSRHDILEAIVYPSASFAREYETVSLGTSSQQLTGIIKSIEKERYEIALGPDASRYVLVEEVENLTPVSQSLMPAGLDKAMDLQELSDLMLYLQSLPDGMYTRANTY
ncbi:PVC-type heme-binding CxxCH protein [Cyclobacterium xiamenense]|uniref:PVC-type heme-binding CxxCH protein n=1 Tax=Cyclobacterium xiamenense TaxID=1297121 RepID=UPI0035D044AD